MKTTFLLLILLTASSALYASDILNEQHQGIRTSNGQKCILSHRQLEYSYPELFISFEAAPNESWKVPDAGLVQAMGLSYVETQKALYGSQKTSVEALKGNYNYTIKAITNGDERIVEIEGITKDDGKRLSQATIAIRKGSIESVKISKKVKGILGGFKTVFSDTCESMSKIK